MGQPPTALQMSLELRTFRAGPETGCTGAGGASSGKDPPRWGNFTGGPQAVLAAGHRVQPWVWLKSQIKHEDRSNETEDSPEVSLCS